MFNNYKSRIGEDNEEAVHKPSDSENIIIDTKSMSSLMELWIIALIFSLVSLLVEMTLSRFKKIIAHLLNGKMFFRLNDLKM